MHTQRVRGMYTKEERGSRTRVVHQQLAWNWIFFFVESWQSINRPCVCIKRDVFWDSETNKRKNMSDGRTAMTASIRLLRWIRRKRIRDPKRLNFFCGSKRDWWRLLIRFMAPHDDCSSQTSPSIPRDRRLLKSAVTECRCILFLMTECLSLSVKVRLLCRQKRKRDAFLLHVLCSLWSPKRMSAFFLFLHECIVSRRRHMSYTLGFLLSSWILIRKGDTTRRREAFFRKNDPHYKTSGRMLTRTREQHQVVLRWWLMHFFSPKQNSSCEWVNDAVCFIGKRSRKWEDRMRMREEFRAESMILTSEMHQDSWWGMGRRRRCLCFVCVMFWEKKEREKKRRDERRGKRSRRREEEVQTVWIYQLHIKSYRHVCCGWREGKRYIREHKAYTRQRRTLASLVFILCM